MIAAGIVALLLIGAVIAVRRSRVSDDQARRRDHYPIYEDSELAIPSGKDRLRGEG